MTERSLESGIILSVGRPLPVHMGLLLASQPEGMGGGLIFEAGLVLMRLDAPSQSELRQFSGPANIRIGDFGSFLLFSPQFPSVSFDLVWSPVIARRSRTTGIPPLENGQRLNLSFALVDERAVVRALRAGTIGPRCTSFLRSTTENLMGRDVDAEQVARDMERVFTNYPHGIPDEAFQARSQIGA